MKRYGISLPFTGYSYFVVEAESEEEAIKKSRLANVSLDDIVEMEYHEHISVGNVLYATMNDMEVQELDDV